LSLVEKEKERDGLTKARELLVACLEAEAKGHHYIQITKSWSRSPYNWDEVRVLPGLYGRIVGQISEERHLVEVKVSEMRECLESLIAAAERAAQRTAEHIRDIDR
jgi:hypothetical protein